MTEAPLVSVVILNHNKKEILRLCLDNALELDWPRLEWIVVDNASSDGSPEMVEAEFGDKVRVIRRTVNSVTAGRNEGFRAARGEVILSLDNDILLPDKQAIRKGLRILEQFPETGLLAFKIGDPKDPGSYLREHWWHPVPFDQGADRFFFTSYFPEAAIFLRAGAFRATGGYDEDYFMGVEQMDLAFKLMREGFQILYCPPLVCVQTETRGQMATRKSLIHYLNMRNKLWTAWKHYPVGRGLWFALERIAASAVRSIRYGWKGHFLAGVRDGVLAPRSIRAQRNPLPPEAWKVYDKIQAGWFPETPNVD
jgi:hypothetical protein